MSNSTACGSGEYLIVRNGGITYQIPRDRIVLVKKNLRQTIIITDGISVDRQIVCYCALRDIHSILDEDIFLYEHQSYIFNANHIVQLCKGRVTVDDGTIIELGRNSYYRLLKAFRDLRKN